MQRPANARDPGGRRDASARLGELRRLGEQLLGAREVEARGVRVSQLDEREALEVGAVCGARDLERLARVELDARQVPLPPARLAQERQHLVARVPRRVCEQLECLLAEATCRGDVGVAVQHDLGELGQRAALDRPFACLAGEVAHGLHLDRSGGQLPEPPRGLCGVEVPLEARLQLDRAQQQPSRGAVRLAGEGPSPCELERSRGLGPELLGNAAVELGDERGRPFEVVRLRLGALVDRPATEPLCERSMQARSLALREAAVGDVANQDVPEAIRELARQGRDGLVGQELTLDEALERGGDVERRVELLERTAPEDATDERAVPEHRAAVGRQAVDACRDQRLHRVRDPRGGAVALLREQSDRLLDEERVALRLVEERASDRVGQPHLLGQRVDELLRLGERQRAELDRDRAASATTPRRVAPRAAPGGRGTRSAPGRRRSGRRGARRGRAGAPPTSGRPRSRARAAGPRRGSSPTRAPPRRSPGRAAPRTWCRAPRRRGRADRRPRRTSTPPSASRTPLRASRRARCRRRPAPSRRAGGR